VNLIAVIREITGNLVKVRELSAENLVSENASWNMNADSRMFPSSIFHFYLAVDDSVF